ncbi:TatD family hydrolase [Sulfurimonas diazotrophicus]|uniref:TatD family hydrolase n=1 Tax=Sulfurimonas diazotrophicus TaxID=3131939 RepID=A0ABZ3HCR7_9BACT
MIIDTHIHLDDERYEEDLDAVLERAEREGVEGLIIPGADVETLPRAIAIAEAHENVFFAVGIHPYDLDGFDTACFDEFLNHPKCVAVGECGLDYFRLEGSEEEQAEEKRKQAEVFRAQIRIALAYGKPLIVHIRNASHDARVILEEEGASRVGGVLHCYNADEELLVLAGQNFYFGIGGVLTFKNARKLVQVLPNIPKERLLIETDGPYLTPHPHRGERNEPAYTKLVAAKMGELLDMPVETVEAVTTRNASRLFGIF